ncbi:MAG TPA: phosphoribosylanthranilate isomerase [Rectinemataceae bacterium]|nr:phosphoribosylanthranilate isomerase [Rectinemataceae bacterium]
MRPRVKICGLTSYEDAALALELGADLIGFVLAPSPRRASPEAVRDIVSRLRAEGRLRQARAVGVFVNEGAEAMAAILAYAGLDEAQVHGDESPEACSLYPFAWYRALRVSGPGDAEGLGRLWAGSPCPRLLFDAASAGAYGGTGLRIGLDAARAAGLACRAASKEFFLAGGLGPDNVAEAIAAIGPDGIDASSALEEGPGRKSALAMRRFFEAVDSAGEAR